MAENYRFSLPDGRVHESEKSPEAIRQAHPQAVITHTIVLDDDGRFVRTEPYGGADAAPASYDDMTVPVLREELASRGIESPSGAKKADLVELLKADDERAEAGNASLPGGQPFETGNAPETGTEQQDA